MGSTTFTRKIINQPSTLRQLNTKTRDHISKNCHPDIMYNFIYLERARLTCRYRGTEVFWTGDLLLYWILQTNHLAFLFLHADSRHNHLYKLAWNRYECLYSLLLHLSHPIDYRYFASYLGNYSKNKFTGYDGYIVTIAPAFNFLAMFFFYICWKGHFFKCISDQEEDNSDVKPEKFCLEIEGLEESYINEEDLTRFFSSFGPVY